MAKFDIAANTFEGFKGYTGNPPSNETEYNAWVSNSDNFLPDNDCIFSGTIPTWTEIQTKMNNYVDPKESGYQKLLDLGLSQAEATALTGYKPEE